MGILRGAASVTRFHYSLAGDLDVAAAEFQPIDPASEIRDAAGVVPMVAREPLGDVIAGGRHTFRVRIDKRRPDAAAVRERLDELVAAEIEAGAHFVGPRRRRDLRELAEEEHLPRNPRTKYIDCVTEPSGVLWVGSTSPADLSTVQAVCRRMGLETSLLTPWRDLDGEPFEGMMDLPPGASLRGSMFLKDQLRTFLAGRRGESGVMLEPETGRLEVAVDGVRHVVVGEVCPAAAEILESSAAWPVKAKLVAGLDGQNAAFTFHALTFRVSSLKVETGKHEHWTELLDERLEKIAAVYGLLDELYEEFQEVIAATRRSLKAIDRHFRGQEVHHG